MAEVITGHIRISSRRPSSIIGSDQTPRVDFSRHFLEALSGVPSPALARNAAVRRTLNIPDDTDFLVGNTSGGVGSVLMAAPRRTDNLVTELANLNTSRIGLLEGEVITEIVSDPEKPETLIGTVVRRTLQ